MKLKAVTLKFEHVETIRRIPGTWTTDDIRALLKDLEVDDDGSYGDSDVEEVALMALQDIGHTDSVTAILTNIKDGQFTPGQIQNMVEELKEDCAWDEYSDLVDHRSLYTCADLLNAAFPKDYPEPSFSHLQITFQAKGIESAVSKHPIDEAVLLRSIARCEPDQCRLIRLFPDQLKSGDFPEASSIIWLMEYKPLTPDSIKLDCYGSSYWFQGIVKGLESNIDIDLA